MSTAGTVAPPEDLPAASWSTPAIIAAGVAVLIGIVLRFVVDTPLWLDEALSVNIAEVGPDGWVDALRQDGHPPLYYALLWLWSDVFGTTDASVRALSGVTSVAILPLAYLAGRRLENHASGIVAVLVFAASPFLIRYGTEARMYALLSLLALALWLLVDSTLERATPLRLLGVTVVTAALLYTHYWSIWLLGVSGLGLLWLGRPSAGPADLVRNARKCAAAVVAGGVLFLPWVPVLLDQMAHTGTPWGGRARPAQVLSTTIFELGGGPRSESQLVGVAIVVLMVAGLFALRTSDGSLSLPMRVAPAARRLAFVGGGTLVVGSLISFATSNTYQPRYAAVIVPLLLLLVVRGVSRLEGHALTWVIGGVTVVSLAAAAYSTNVDRSQAIEIAAAVEAGMMPGDVVVFCPDQLGPANSRYLPEGLVAITYPDRGDPARVDWRDYADRSAAADPAAFATATDAQAGGNAIWLVLSTGYRTFEGQCERLIESLTANRSAETIVAANAERYEPAALVRFSPPS